MAQDQKTHTITEITQKIKLSLEQNFQRVWLQGEISNFKRHTSGHLYFTLKDEGAQISAVMWRSRIQNLSMNPADGMKVIARGAITVYPPRGNYQIDVDQLQPLGIGELQQAFERLKQKLASEGLFDEAHKKPLPEYPERIGIITSPTGAAIKDILSVLSRRFPSLEILFTPVLVQGSGAAEEIASAIRAMNEYGNVDVLIVGRGGGSLEDLWAFNEEIVAREIFASKIPVVSAVGHEIDFSIADFVADLRAPTPSAAAELVVKDRRELIEVIGNICYTLRDNLTHRIDTLRNRIQSIVSSYSFNRPKDLLHQSMQRLDELDRSMALSMIRMLNDAQQRSRHLQARLGSVNPDDVLKRGYTIIRKEGRVVSSVRRVTGGDDVQIQFHDGTVLTKVQR
ncbi:MAG: exodeoxyribonuclease VII large subunit [bacterium]